MEGHGRIGIKTSGGTLLILYCLGVDVEAWTQIKQQALQALQISLGMGFFFSMKS